MPGPRSLRQLLPLRTLLTASGLVLLLSSSGRADPTQLQIFEGPAKTPTENVVKAKESDLAFNDKKPYAECWFYLAVAEDGTVFYTHFNLMKISWMVKKNSIDFGLNPPGGENEFFASGYDDDVTHAATDKLDIAMGKNTLKGNLAGQKIHIEEKGTVIDLSFSAQVPAFREGDGKIWMNKKKDKYLALTVQPAMRFEGTISRDGKKRTLKGWAYSDHVRQTVIPTDFAKQVRSYRIDFGDVFISAMEYYPITDYLPSRVPLLVVTHKDKVIHVSLNYESKPTAEYTDPKTSTKVPQSFVLTDKNGSFHLECTAQGKQIQRIDYLASVSGMLRKSMQLLGYKSYGYIFDEKTECKLESPEVSGTYAGKGVLEVLMSE